MGWTRPSPPLWDQCPAGIQRCRGDGLCSGYMGWGVGGQVLTRPRINLPWPALEVPSSITAHQAGLAIAVLSGDGSCAPGLRPNNPRTSFNRGRRTYPLRCVPFHPFCLSTYPTRTKPRTWAGNGDPALQCSRTPLDWAGQGTRAGDRSGDAPPVKVAARLGVTGRLGRGTALAHSTRTGLVGRQWCHVSFLCQAAAGRGDSPCALTALPPLRKASALLCPAASAQRSPFACLRVLTLVSHSWVPLPHPHPPTRPRPHPTTCVRAGAKGRSTSAAYSPPGAARWHESCSRVIGYAHTRDRVSRVCMS